MRLRCSRRHCVAADGGVPPPPRRAGRPFPHGLPAPTGGPQRSPPSITVVHSAGLRGRHNVPSLAHSGFRQRPVASTPTASWPRVVHGCVGGDRGVGQTDMAPLRGPFALSLSKGRRVPILPTALSILRLHATAAAPWQQMRLRRPDAGFRARATGRKTGPARPPCTHRRPPRSPPSITDDCSAGLRGRHKVTSLCLSGFRRRPGDSPPSPGWSRVSQRRAGGDQGGKRDSPARYGVLFGPTRLSSATLTQQPDSALGLVAGRGNRRLPRASPAQGCAVERPASSSRTGHG